MIFLFNWVIFSVNHDIMLRVVGSIIHPHILKLNIPWIYPRHSRMLAPHQQDYFFRLYLDLPLSRAPGVEIHQNPVGKAAKSASSLLKICLETVVGNTFKRSSPNWWCKNGDLLWYHPKNTPTKQTQVSLRESIDLGTMRIPARWWPWFFK